MDKGEGLRRKINKLGKYSENEWRLFHIAGCKVLWLNTGLLIHSQPGYTVLLLYLDTLNYIMEK